MSGLSQNDASWRSTRFLWAGFGFAVVMLIGVAACALDPLASHTSAQPSRHLPSLAFVRSKEGANDLRASHRPVVLPGMKHGEQRHPETVPLMSVQAEAEADTLAGPLDFPIKDISRGVFGRSDIPPESKWATGNSKYATGDARWATRDGVTKWPYTEKDFSRMDETDDSSFYAAPKLVYHIDAGARAALTNYYATTIAVGADILDICSSWVSHYPSAFPETMDKICGTGMNKLELEENKQLTGGFEVSDLNKDPTLPYPDESFDVVTCVVSVDYLIKPREVFKEVARVLKPGGRFIVSISDKMFEAKAIARWKELGTVGRLKLIQDYFYYSESGFGAPHAFDISAKPPKSLFDTIVKFGQKVASSDSSDPIYIVEATKQEQ